MPNTPLRIIFAGTPDFAAIHLKALVGSKHTLLAVYTQPDRPAGRGKKMQASPVKLLAQEAGLPLFQPPTLKASEVQEELLALEADVMIVVAYGLILPQAVLDATRLGCLNVHASLLPRWRGAAPIQRAIEAGDDVTGVTIMQMDAGLDTGAMLATKACPISPEINASGLHDRLAVLGPPLLLEVLEDLPRYLRDGRQQDNTRATYAHKMIKSEAQLDWRETATTLDYKIRAFNPYPICYSTLDDETVRIWQARPLPATSDNAVPGTILQADEQGIVVNCGEGRLLVEVLQLPGGKALHVGQVLLARKEQFAPGRCFNTCDQSQS